MENFFENIMIPIEKNYIDFEAIVEQGDKENLLRLVFPC